MTVLTSAKIYFCLLLFMMINSILSVEFSYPYYYYKKKSFYVSRVLRYLLLYVLTLLKVVYDQ